MATLLQDLKFAVRNLRRTPGFTAVVVLTLALGIGANTSIFSIVYGVVLRPLPYAEPQQLVRITSELRGFGASDTGMAAQELFDYQARTDLFSNVSGLYPINANLTGGEAPERVEVMLVTYNYFETLGAQPALGRVLGPQDDGPGIPEVAVVSDGYWRRRLGGDPDAIGRTLLVDGDPFVLVGVMPPDFRHPGRTVQTEVDLWSPAGYRDTPFSAPNRTRRFLNGAIARLQPGVSVAQAQAGLDAYAADVRTQHSADYPAGDGWNPLVVPLQDDVVENVAATMWILLGAVGLVLLIACVNVANLVLTRAAERQQEMAIRRSLGASQGRLTRQMLTESAVLAAAGGGLGLLVASWGVQGLVALAPSRVPRLSEVALDGTAVAITVTLSVLTTMLFGLAPAWQLRRRSSFAAIKDGAAGRTGGPAKARVRHALVSSEVAFAMVLLVGAGLLIRSVGRLLDVPTGFETGNLVTARIWLPRPNDPAAGVYLQADRRVAFYRDVLARVDALPGVERAAMATQIPLGGFNPPIFVELEGREAAAGGRPVMHSFQVSPSYFETLGIPLVRGRAFTNADRAGTEPVVVVSEAAARRYWGTDDPVGRRIRLAPQAPWMTVVGLVGDVQNRRLDEPPQPILYRTLEQSSNLTLALLVRTAGDLPGLETALTREVRAVDPNLPLYAVRTMDDILAANVAERRFLMRVLVAFGAAAVGLAIIGLYGVISYSVAQRTREIGIRMAVGAEARDVAALVLGQGLRVTAIGIGIGLAGALSVTRLIESQLFGVGSFDVVTVGAVVLVMGVTTLAATAIPARRAARVDPILALRRDG